MRIYNIVLLFSFVSIYYKVRSDSLQGGTFLNNKMMDSYVLLWIKNAGPKICVRNCMSYTGCNAVNYNKQNMTCQLLKMSYPGDHINDQSESMFTEIDKWTLVRTIYHITMVKKKKTKWQRYTKLKNRVTRIPLKPVLNSAAPDGLTVSAPLVQ
jgi:hypothetical protein